MAEDRNRVNRRTFLKATGAAGASVTLANVAAAHPEGDAAGGGRQLLVGVTDAATPAAVGTELPDSASVVSRNDDLGYLLVELPENAGTYSTLQVESQIATDSRVKYTEPNATFYPHEAPDDRLFDQQYAPQQVRADTAWEKTEGSSDVTIAIVDQGVKYDHPDLQSQFGSNKGKDFVDDDDDPMPEDLANEYHGTHVAGIASATTGNGTGVAGISDSTLLSCRALGTRGGQTSDIADAVKWATDQGADLVNMSLGGGGYSETMKNAVSYAVNNGCLPLASAGNSCTSPVGYPARYNECVAVSAIDEAEELADFSNYGSNVDITGPGVNVLSCWTEKPENDPYDGKYNAISGTSMSCPAVTGVAALGKAANPDLSPTELRQKLKDTAVDIGLPAEEQGAGRADAVAMVDGVSGSGSGPTAEISVDPSDPHVGEKVIVDGQGSTDDGYVTGWSWDFGDGTTATGEQQFHAYDSAGERTIELTVTDDSGATDTATATVNVQSGACGTDARTEEYSGTVESSEARDSYTYSFKTDEPCKLEADIEGKDGFILYFSQRSTDFLVTECENQIVVRPRDLRDIDTGSDLTVGIYAGDGSDAPSGDYTVTMREYGFTGGGGGSNESPTADFSASSSTVAPDETVDFDASASSDPDGSIASYEWEFGDGTTASGETVSHSYASAGTYTVTLTVTDDGGKSDSTSRSITVEDSNAAPSAAFDLSASSVTVGETVSADASASSDPDGSIASYDWSFGDGTTAGGETASHSYGTAGTYTVELTVTDGDGASDTASQSVVVEESGGGGECGDVTETTVETGRLTGNGSEAYTYATQTAGPCEVTFSLTADANTDFDLYVTLDGRTPTTYDYDKRSYNYGSDEEIVVDEVDASSELGVLVDSYSGAGEYELTIEEVGSGSGGGDPEPDPNEDPEAGFTASDGTVTVGSTVSFDGAPSSDPDGSIAAYDWSFGDGATASGQLVEHAFSAAGEYDVTLTVTDDDGATDAATRTVTVEEESGGGGGSCGDARESASAEGSLSSSYDDASYSYTAQLADPCQVTVSLSGASGTDFDLYVTTDGRTPTSWDYDERSVTVDSEEQITLDSVSAGQEFGILVDAWDGSGSFTVSVEELGK